MMPPMQRPPYLLAEEFRNLVHAAPVDGHTGNRVLPINDETLRGFRGFAASVGMLHEFLEFNAQGLVVLRPFEAEYIDRHLSDVQDVYRELAHLPEAPKRPLLSEFPYGSMLAAAPAMQELPRTHPKLNKLLRDTHMLVIGKSSTGRYSTLLSPMQSRERVVDAMALIRPDIASTVRARMTQEDIQPDAIGGLPMSVQQIHDFHASFNELNTVFRTEGADEAARHMEKMHRKYLVKTPAPRVQSPVRDHRRLTPTGPVIKQDGRMVLSERPRDESVNHFMLPLASLDPALDLAQRLDHARTHPPDGKQDKYYPSKGEAGEYWMLFADAPSADNAKRLLQQLLNDGEAIRHEQVVVSHKPQHWIAVPTPLCARIIDEAALMSECLKDTATAFEAGNREAANANRAHIMQYLEQRGFPLFKGHEAALRASKDSDLSGSQSR
ncbi:MAG: hypothetical protein DI582_02430 [Azospirillum brasilense]|nr:MAG: hypothetical protein DI582_02430 [Azospirillum brasilense]